MANYWMHNGFLQVEGEKMSKSLGNFFTIREVLAEWPGEVIRHAMLRTHYRQPIDWTKQGLEECRKVLDDWYEIVGEMEIPTGASPDMDVMNSLCDDLNTPSVLACLHALASEIRGSASGLHQIELKRKFKASGTLLGLLTRTRREYLESDPRRPLIDGSKVKKLIEARAHARQSRNFAQADSIRNELTEMGVEIEDLKDGTTTWRPKR
jgi:cysteinyl-tRNA synthetase